MIIAIEVLGLYYCLAFVTLCIGAPMGPPSNPMTTLKLKSEELIDSGAHSGKIATDAIHNQIMNVNNLQSSGVAVAGAQIQDLSQQGMQQQKVMGEVIQKQLMAAFLQQQQLAEISIQAQKEAAEALHNQLLAAIDFHHKLMSVSAQIPQVMVGTVQQPMATVQSLAQMSGMLPMAGMSPMAGMQSLAGMPLAGLQALTGQMQPVQSQQSNIAGMIPIIGGLDKFITLPFTLFSPLMTAATNTMAAIPGIALNASR